MEVDKMIAKEAKNIFGFLPFPKAHDQIDYGLTLLRGRTYNPSKEKKKKGF